MRQNENSEMETRVWWLKGPWTLEVLQTELKRCEERLRLADKAFREELELNGDTDALIGPVSNMQECERMIRCLEWDIKHWPRPI